MWIKRCNCVRTSLQMRRINFTSINLVLQRNIKEGNVNGINDYDQMEAGARVLWCPGSELSSHWRLVTTVYERRGLKHVQHRSCDAASDQTPVHRLLQPLSALQQVPAHEGELHRGKYMSNGTEIIPGVCIIFFSLFGPTSNKPTHTGSLITVMWQLPHWPIETTSTSRKTRKMRKTMQTYS